ncbi:hypothetical protein K8Z49_08670 [Actinomadura madurae]
MTTPATTRKGTPSEASEDRARRRRHRGDVHRSRPPRRVTPDHPHRQTAHHPDGPGRGVLAGIQRLLQESAIGWDDVATIVHGTTLITNTVLERTGAEIGLITTEGFRDVLEMRGRGPVRHREPLRPSGARPRAPEPALGRPRTGLGRRHRAPRPR